jgi:hypothetical protein
MPWKMGCTKFLMACKSSSAGSGAASSDADSA